MIPLYNSIKLFNPVVLKCPQHFLNWFFKYPELSGYAARQLPCYAGRFEVPFYELILRKFVTLII